MDAKRVTDREGDRSSEFISAHEREESPPRVRDGGSPRGSGEACGAGQSCSPLSSQCLVCGLPAFFKILSQDLEKIEMSIESRS